MSQADKSGWTITTRDIKAEFEKLLDELGRQVSTRFFMSAQGHNSTKQVGLLSSTPDIQELFLTAHNVHQVPHEVGGVTVYHLERIDRGVSQRFCNVESELAKPAMCIYNRESRELLVLEHQPFNYGFVNTTIIGVFSKAFLQEDGEHYAHAGCMSVNGRGLLVLGDQGAGKSTLVSKMLSRLEGKSETDVRFCTDDWVYLSEQGGRLLAKRASKEYRIDADTINSSAISLSDSFMAAITKYNIQEKAAKFSMPVQALCEQFGYASTEILECGTVVVLNPGQDEFISRASYESIEGILKSSTKNVPPLTAEENFNLAEFWRHQIRVRRVISINNRQRGTSIDQVVDEVLHVAEIVPRI